MGISEDAGAAVLFGVSVPSSFILSYIGIKEEEMDDVPIDDCAGIDEEMLDAIVGKNHGLTWLLRTSGDYMEGKTKESAYLCMKERSVTVELDGHGVEEHAFDPYNVDTTKACDNIAKVLEALKVENIESPSWKLVVWHDRS